MARPHSGKTFESPFESPRPAQKALVAGGVLAGGASRRMGQPKALLPWPPGSADQTMLDALLRCFDMAGVGPVAVVTGTHHREILAATAPARPALPILFNPRHDEGQLTSLWRLLDWAGTLPASPDWLAVTLVDMPSVRPATVRRLVEVAAECDQRTWVVRPAIGARHGHPVLWRRPAWPRLRAAPLEQGAKAVVHALVDVGRVCNVEVDDEGATRDIDTPQDYARG